MRISSTRYIIVAAAAAAWPTPTHAAFYTFWQSVAIPPAAVADDPRLANMTSLDLMVSTDGDWESARLRAMLPQGSTFYSHSFGSTTKPSPALTSIFPSLAFTTYVTSPGATIVEGFQPGEPASIGDSDGQFSVAWRDEVISPPGTYQLARLTFPSGVVPTIVNTALLPSRSLESAPDKTVVIPNHPFAFSFLWAHNGDGEWHVPGNWSGGVPTFTGHVYIDVDPQVVHTITHSQGNTHIISLNSQEHVLVSGGTLSVSDIAHVGNGLTVSGAALGGRFTGSPITIGPAGARLGAVESAQGISIPAAAPVIVNQGLILHGTSILSAGTTLQFEGAQTLGGTGYVQFDGAARIDIGAGDTLTLGSDLTIRKAGAEALRINGGFAQSAGSVIDMVQGSVINDYTGPSPFDAIRANIISGYNSGSWNGTGINSSTAAADDSVAVGYAEASALFTTFPATFEGEQIDDTTVLVRLTRAGDANLDGVVNLADFNRLAANFGSTTAVWSDGDFNYDGSVNLADFNKLAANFGLAASGAVAPTPDDWSNLASAVPEPGPLSLAGVAASAAMLRRRCARR